MTGRAHPDAATIARRRVVQALAAAPLVAALPARAADAADEPRRRFEARHNVTIAGRRIAYRTVSGDTVLRGADGPIGSIFSFSYLRESVAAAEVDARPVVFVFNGGPGSSSIWLHLGVMGPRTVRLGRNVDPSVLPPFALEDNAACILDIADLVFVDPVGTGFSRVRGKGKSSDFYGVDEDAASVAQFIDLWLSEHDRWNSPKYVMGESYGSVRAAVLQRMLMGGPDYGGVLHAISLNGVILVGPVLGQTGSDRDEAAVMTLPNMAATARYHGRIPADGRPLHALVDDAMAFAEGPYLQALRQGSRLPADQREAVITHLAAFTGLSRATLLRSDLRLDGPGFARTLLEDKGLDVGLYDSRYTLAHQHDGIALDPVGDDPAMAQYTPGFAAAWHRYLLRDLRVGIDETYGTIVWSGVSRNWRYQRSGVPEGQSYAVDLALAMRRNPKLRLMVATGYYDLATPIMAAEAAIARAGAPLDRVRMHRYESGHMVYFGGTGASFLRDVRAFVADG